LSRIDYEDAVLVENCAAQERTAEQWVRAIMEDATVAIEANLLLGWSAIDLMPTLSASRRSVLGWKIQASTPDFVLLGRPSLIRMPAELLFQAEARRTAVRHFCPTREPDRVRGLGGDRASACADRARPARAGRPSPRGCRDREVIVMAEAAEARRSSRSLSSGPVRSDGAAPVCRLPRRAAQGSQ